VPLDAVPLLLVRHFDLVDGRSLYVKTTTPTERRKEEYIFSTCMIDVMYQRHNAARYSKMVFIKRSFYSRIFTAATYLADRRRMTGTRLFDAPAVAETMWESLLLLQLLILS